MPIICHDVSVQYGARLALNALALTIRPGEMVSLIGPNGSGKSTALRAMAGLNVPTSGDVSLDGCTLRNWKRRDLAKRLSFLPQSPLAPEELTVENLVRQGRYAHVGLFRNYTPQDSDAVAWALESTGMASFARRGLRELSGGERQRAWIAAALAQEAEILILDEPTSFLDSGHQVEVFDLLGKLSSERGVTVIMAIHDVNQAMTVSDRILLLQSGTLRFDGRASDLAGSGLVEEAFKVEGTFVTLDQHGTPHFDVTMRARQRAN